MTDLNGQVVIVTGASSGLGRRFAEVLAESGAKVAATARRLDKLTELAESIASNGGTCVPVQLDVTDAEALAPAIDAVEEQLGAVTALVNNAGIPDAQYATRMPVELVDKVLATNLRAPWLLSCEVARRWIEREFPGRIVNISSMGGFTYGGGAAALYSVTKAAINRVTEVLAVEWAKYRINVNAIAPGAFHSEMMDGMIERTGRDASRFFPRGRMGDPPELDSTILYLLSPASAFVTGTIIKVDDAQGPR